ncbi:hypothetical protein PFISCL1PPCAC_11891, partial [Pristionchus fissidentatus]
ICRFPMQGKCCCGLMSSSTGSKILSVVSMITSISLTIICKTISGDREKVNTMEEHYDTELVDFPVMWAVLSTKSAV